MTYRLKDSHDFSKRFEELCAKASELEISIDWNYSNVMPTKVTDTKTNREYELRDVDNNEFCCQFPPIFEYKITFDK